MFKKLLINFILIATLLMGTVSPAYATAALTSAGVQCSSITIASGATTNTATINAVGTGAFLVWGGSTSGQASTSPAKSQVRITKTNATTVTAVRNTSDTTTTTTSFCMVDGDTTNLIKSVQYGTILVGASTTATATISAVTTANTAVELLGASDTNTSISAIAQFATLDLTNTTTVTATLGSAGTNHLTVSFVVIEFQGSALNQSVQAISDTASPGTATRTHTITSVTQGNTFLLFAGQRNAGAAYTSGFQYGSITANTTLTIGTNTAPNLSTTYNCFIVELVSSLVETSAQRGIITLSAASSGTASLSPTYTLAHAFTTYGGNSTSGTNFNATLGNLTLTNTSTETAAFGTSSTGKFGWEVIALNPVGAAPSPFGGNNLWVSFDGL